ncbi:DUF1836 domain-containing protein [Bacillus sp. BGMRC 2118]|nr:DUF1836 domain-containing protein [Bacillus sp. BGMRC 2118]
MEDVERLLESLTDMKHIELEDIPVIDLYMDQVMQLFDTKLATGEERVLTKTMINNYAKSGLLLPIKNKKYTKEHIILLSLINQLKGSLKINEIKKLLEELNQKIVNEELSLQDFYRYYLQLMNKNTAHFSRHLQTHMKEATELAAKKENLDSSYVDKVLLISSFAQMSNLYRQAAETLVSEIAEEK